MSPTASSRAARKPKNASSRGRKANVPHQKQAKNPSEKKAGNYTFPASIMHRTTLTGGETPLQSGRLIYRCVVRYAAKRLVKIQRAQLVSFNRAPTGKGTLEAKQRVRVGVGWVLTFTMHFLNGILENANSLSGMVRRYGLDNECLPGKQAPIHPLSPQSCP